jgi:LysR family glycine cleavage system transcriptional activator
VQSQARRGPQRIAKAADLAKFPLLRLEGAKNWARLFEAAGLNATVGPGPVLNRASMLIDAAIDGQGIALARTALAAWDLINGRLVRPVGASLRMANTYWIVCQRARRACPRSQPSGTGFWPKLPKMRLLKALAS